MAGCVFCEIVAGRAPATVVREWPDVIAFVPLNPVTDGHVLVIPRVHVVDVGEDAIVSAAVGARVSELVAELPYANVITSKGAAASQTVGHYHEHVVPRRPGDGLLLPWTSQQQTSAPTVIKAPSGVFHTGTGDQFVSYA